MTNEELFLLIQALERQVKELESRIKRIEIRHMSCR